MSIKYLKVSVIKDFVNQNDRRCGKDFLKYLDNWVGRRIQLACKEHNGGKKTLDETMAIYTFGKI